MISARSVYTPRQVAACRDYLPPENIRYWRSTKKDMVAAGLSRAKLPRLVGSEFGRRAHRFQNGLKVARTGVSKQYTNYEGSVEILQSYESLRVILA